MNTNFNIISIVGARPNFIKLAPLYKILRNNCKHTIIHTGQHYDFEMSEIFFQDLSIPTPNKNLEIGSGSSCYQIGEMIKKIETILSMSKYDLVLVYGDTNSTFAGAFAAVKSGVKIAHVEAGLRSFDQRMPEELNRRLTDSISNILFAPTPTAAENLRREHVPGKTFYTGDLSVEIINESIKVSRQSKVLDIFGLKPKSYVLFTLHRAENTEFKESLISMIEIFKNLKDKINIFPIHPRTRKKLIEMQLYDKLLSCKNVKVIEPLGYLDFIALMINSEKIVTDSGGIQKESYLLSVPCITMRKNTEWVETVREGWNVLVDLNVNKIVEHVREWYPSQKIQKSIFGNGLTSSIIRDKILEEL